MRFCGKIGYGLSVQSAPGVWSDNIVEKTYFGDVIRNTRQLQQGEYLNDNLTVSNAISVVADAYAFQHFFAVRYVEWQGSLWRVSNVEVQRPRLILQLGEVYNGPRPA